MAIPNPGIQPSYKKYEFYNTYLCCMTRLEPK